MYQRYCNIFRIFDNSGAVLASQISQSVNTVNTNPLVIKILIKLNSALAALDKEKFIIYCPKNSIYIAKKHKSVLELEMELVEM